MDMTLNMYREYQICGISCIRPPKKNTLIVNNTINNWTAVGNTVMNCEIHLTLKIDLKWYLEKYASSVA